MYLLYISVMDLPITLFHTFFTRFDQNALISMQMDSNLVRADLITTMVMSCTIQMV